VKAPLVANFTHTAPQCYCTNITFNGTATGGSPDYTFSWVFGDGNSDTGQNTNHHYDNNTNEIYNVTLTVTDSGTNTSSISKDVQVWPTPVANFTTNSPQIYCHNINFTDTTTGGTPSYTYYWDFDDGHSSTEQNTSHHYSATGTYNVTLNVTDVHNCMNSKTRPVVALNYTADLAITKTANVSNATVGTVIGYNITVNNTGNVDLTNVLVTDVKLGLSQTIATMVPNASQTFNPTYTVTQADICAPINNTATANGTDPCGGAVGPVNASVSVPTTSSPDFTIEKSADVSTATVGEIITYTYTVNNTGNAQLTIVAVTDSLLGVVTMSPTTVAVGGTATGQLTYTVTQTDVDSSR
jgi:uncharacterized repeat protein (TIGR01451 family)